MAVRDPETITEVVAWLEQWAERIGCTFERAERIDNPGFNGYVMCLKAQETEWVYYRWLDERANTMDPNGLMWVPEGAYLKHDVVAIVVDPMDADAEEDALRSFYEWGRWFDARGFDVQTSRTPGETRIVRPATPEPTDRFARMRWLLETGGTDGIPEVIEMLIDEAQEAADGRGARWRSRVDERLGQTAEAIDNVARGTGYGE